MSNSKSRYFKDVECAESIPRKRYSYEVTFTPSESSLDNVSP